MQGVPANASAGHGSPDLAGGHAFVWKSAAWKAAAAVPKLSILVPFRNEDCEPLIASLLQAADALGADVEVVVADDCADDPAVRYRLQARLTDADVPGAVLIAARNLGRSAIRNALARIARAEYLLFIDAGMEVPGPHYLKTYLTLCEELKPGMVFGGYAATEVMLRRADALAAYEFLNNQCRSAAVRRERPWQYSYAGNLLLHRRVAAACPFDEAFGGWGWEDVEVGIRVARRFTIEHIDNPVFRTDLPSAPELCCRFEESAGNFARTLLLHPNEMKRLPIFKAARIAAKLPHRILLRQGLRWLALKNGLPNAVRLLALKMCRACVYADFLERGGAKS
jgi:glycosyltransferase involved in cell wall biosynthesis